MKLGMTYTNDARIVSLNITCHHEPRVREPSGGKLGTLTNLRHARATLQNAKVKYPAKGQRAARDIYTWMVQSVIPLCCPVAPRYCPVAPRSSLLSCSPSLFLVIVL